MHYLCLDSNHLLRFWKACPRAGILLRRSASLWHRAHALLALCSNLPARSFGGCKLGLCMCPLVRLHSSVALLVRGALAPLSSSPCNFQVSTQSQYQFLVLRHIPHLVSRDFQRLPRPLDLTQMRVPQFEFSIRVCQPSREFGERHPVCV